TQERHHLARHLQVRDIRVQIDAVQALQIETDMAIEQLVDVRHLSHGAPPTRPGSDPTSPPRTVSHSPTCPPRPSEAGLTARGVEELAGRAQRGDRAPPLPAGVDVDELDTA